MFHFRVINLKFRIDAIVRSQSFILNHPKKINATKLPYPPPPLPYDDLVRLRYRAVHVRSTVRVEHLHQRTTNA